MAIAVGIGGLLMIWMSFWRDATPRAYPVIYINFTREPVDVFYVGDTEPSASLEPRSVLYSPAGYVRHGDWDVAMAILRDSKRRIVIDFDDRKAVPILEERLLVVAIREANDTWSK